MSTISTISQPKAGFLLSPHGLSVQKDIGITAPHTVALEEFWRSPGQGLCLSPSPGPVPVSQGHPGHRAESKQLLLGLSLWEVGQQAYLKSLQSLEMELGPSFGPADFGAGSHSLDMASDTSLVLSKHGVWI